MSIQLGLLDLGAPSTPVAPSPLQEARPGDGITRTARLSSCGLYRYTLSRLWGARRMVTFVALNPSTASADLDDPTSRKMVAYARAWGFDAMTIVNLFAFRDKSPVGLTLVKDPVGPENDATIEDAAELCAASDGLLVAAWGASHRATVDRRKHLGARDMEVLAILTKHVDVHCLTVTADGMPGHPLYLDGALRPKLYRARVE